MTANLFVPTGATGPTGSNPIIAFDNVIDNAGGAYDGTDTFTAPATGLYHFDVNLPYQTVGDHSIRFRLLRNGSSFGVGWLDFSTDPILLGRSATLAKQLTLNTNDTVQVQAVNDGNTQFLVIGVAATGAEIGQFDGRRVE